MMGQEKRPSNNGSHRLDDGDWDALIVGGGIVGAGVARDAAMRGLRVALIDRHDFAFGRRVKEVSRPEKTANQGVSASCTTRIPAESDQISAPNIQYKTHSQHAADELPASR